MKLTKREIMLLFVLGTVAVVFIGVNYLILPLYNSNQGLRDNLAALNDQLLTLGTDQQITGSIDGQIEKEMEKTTELSAPFAQSIRPEQVAYWLNSLLKANHMELNAIEFTDVVSAAPNFANDQPVPPSDKLELPIQNTADMVSGKQAAAADATAALPAEQPAAQPSAQPSGTAADGQAQAGATAEDASASPETYCTQAILNATGSYADISRFMEALYAGGRPLTVDSLTISDYQNGGKMAVIAIRFFSAPLPEGVQGGAYSFPAPAGNGPLMRENTPAEPTPTESAPAESEAP